MLFTQNYLEWYIQIMIWIFIWRNLSSNDWKCNYNNTKEFLKTFLPSCIQENIKYLYLKLYVYCISNPWICLKTSCLIDCARLVQNDGTSTSFHKDTIDRKVWLCEILFITQIYIIAIPLWKPIYWFIILCVWQ